MTKRKLKAELEAMRLPELQAKFAEVTGEESRAPNRKFLIRKITEAMEGGEAPEKPADAKGKKAKAPKKAAPDKATPEKEPGDGTASGIATMLLVTVTMSGLICADISTPLTGISWLSAGFRKNLFAMMSKRLY